MKFYKMKHEKMRSREDFCGGTVDLKEIVLVRSRIDGIIQLTYLS